MHRSIGNSVPIPPNTALSGTYEIWSINVPGWDLRVPGFKKARRCAIIIVHPMHAVFNNSRRCQNCATHRVFTIDCFIEYAIIII